MAMNKRWSAYEGAWTETPFLTSWIGPHLKWFFAFRWFCTYPLQRRLPFSTLTISEVILLPIPVIWIAGSVVVGGEDFTGSSATWCMALAFATASHNSIWTFLLGLPFERALIYHKGLGYLSIVLGIYHGVVSGMNASGVAIVVLLFLQAFSAFYLVRRAFFEVFYRLHWIFFILMIFFCVIHGAGAVMVGVVAWLVDLAYRSGIMAFRVLPKKAKFVRLPADVVRVTFPKPANFHYRGGQYVFLCVPKLSLFEWHPFSISSSPGSKTVSLHIRVLGDWTRRLQKLVGEEIQKSVQGSVGDSEVALNSVCELGVLMEGPFGSPMVNLDTERYKIVILLSGGIGVTPMQSICNELLEQTARGRNMKKIYFVWSVRDRFIVDAVYDKDFIDDLPGRLPQSFSPDLLARNAATETTAQPSFVEKTKDILVSEFYLTKVRVAEEYDAANIHPNVQSALRFERPQLPKIFDTAHAFAKAEKETRIAVLVCGPSSMMEEAKRLAKMKSTEGVTFDYHHETFEF